MSTPSTHRSARRAALLGLAATGLALWAFGGYGAGIALDPRAAPWWEVHLLADAPPPLQASTPMAPVRAVGSTLPPQAAPVVAEPWTTATATWRVAAGEALVRFDGTDSEDDVVAALRSAGATFVDIGARSGVARVQFGADVTARDAVASAASVAGVTGVTPNAITTGAACGPGDLVPYQWERSRAGTDATCADQSASAPVTIAILDTGVAYENWSDASGTYVQVPELADVPIVTPWDFVNGDSHANDDHQHGTHLAGLIASRDRLRGHASNPVLMPVKVLNDQMMGTEFALVEGLHWAADNGAQVVNLSLTFDIGYLPSAELFDAVSAVHLAGGVLVAAAGNHDSTSVAHPAAMLGVIAVGGYQNAGAGITRAAYSNSGWTLDLLGPGGNVDNDVDADGVPDGLVAQTIDPADPTAVSYWAIAGTSQATAVVSAQAANLLGQGLDPRSARDGLLLLAKTVDTRTELSTAEGRGAADTSARSGFTGTLASPGAFINVVQAITHKKGSFELEARVEVVDATGQAIPDVWVRGHLTGSLNEQVGTLLDGDGVGTISSSKLPGLVTDPVFFALSIDAIHIPRGDAWNNQSLSDPYPNGETNDFFPMEPGGFYRLDEGNHATLTSGLASNPAGGIVFRMAASDTTGAPKGSTVGDICVLFSCKNMVDSYMVTSLGSGLSSSTVNVSFNWPYLQAIGGSGLSSSTVNFSLGGVFMTPWGASSKDTMEVWNLGGSGLSSSTVNVLRWSPWMYGSGLSSSTVNVLNFDPQIFGSGAGSTSIYFVDDTSPLWGSGLSSSTVNALDFFGPSSSGGLSGWGSLLGSGLSSSTVNVFSWPRMISGAVAQPGTAVAIGAAAGVGQGAVPTAL